MKSKTKGEDWATARKKIITEALQNRPQYIKHRELPRQQPLRRPKHSPKK